MKRLSFIPILMLPVVMMAQSMVYTKPGAVNIVKEFKPAVLSIVGDIAFEDATGNNAIDANEKCKLVFQVANTGMGDGYGCEVIVEGTGATQGITYASKKLQVIKQNSTQYVEIPISTNMNTIDGELDLTIEVREPNGFGTKPYGITLNTKAFEAPYLQVMDWVLTGTSKVLQPATPFDIQLLLQNTQYGLAEDVYVDISVPVGVVFIDNGTSHFKTKLGDMAGGVQQLVECGLMATRNYHAPTIPVTVTIREKYGKYAENKTFELSFNQTFASTKMRVEEIKQERQDIRLASLTSAVDKNIPRNAANNDNTFAFIIANENYQNSNFSHILHAQNDGKVFADYCRMTLGIPERNIHLRTDATFAQMIQMLQQIKNTASVNPNSHIIFYYSGHGGPSEGTQEAFLIPVDAYNVGELCLSLQRLYDDLRALQDSRVTVFLDACFSGTNREGTITAMSKGVAIKPKKNRIEGNLVVFSAATGSETAWPYAEEGHGMFTYFLLKKLQETAGDVTYQDLYDYLYLNVRRESNNINGKIQTPTINPSPNLGESWKEWMFF